MYFNGSYDLCWLYTFLDPNLLLIFIMNILGQKQIISVEMNTMSPAYAIDNHVH